jgi:acetyl esterase/lipase
MTTFAAPSLGDKFGLGFTITKTIIVALTRLCTSPFKGQKGAPTYFKDVFYAAMRSQLRGMTLEQNRLINKSSTEEYHNFTKSKGLTPESIDLPDGTQAHWLGDKNATITLLHFHGGGYALPATVPHYTYLFDLITLLNKTGASVSALVLAYTLAPEAAFPTQLAQASTLITYLVEKENRSPSNLILAGDSAGGNLLLSLFSHILHPHLNPDVPHVELKEPFRAALLLSPWVSFATDHPSYKTNAESDLLDAKPLNMWARGFLGSTQRQNIIMGDSYSEPLLAEPSWWNGASNVVKEVMIWGGGGEVFIDGIQAFASKFEQGWVSGGGDRKKVKLVVTPRMAHEEMILDVILGYKTKGIAALEVEDWMKSKL